MTDVEGPDRPCATQARGQFNECDGFHICSSCLQLTNCMIDRNGDCVSQNAYDNHYDYALAMNRYALPDARTNPAVVLSNRFSYQFRALSVTYCSADDAVCKECTASNFWAPESLGNVSDSRFCVGQSGCVCIFNCQVPSKAQCRASNGTNAPSTTTTPVPATSVPTTTSPATTSSPPTTSGPQATTPPQKQPLFNSSSDTSTIRTTPQPSESSDKTQWIILAVGIAFLVGCLVPVLFRRHRRGSHHEVDRTEAPRVRAETPVSESNPEPLFPPSQSFSAMRSPRGRVPPSAPPLDLQDLSPPVPPVRERLSLDRPMALEPPPELYRWISPRHYLPQAQGLDITTRDRLDEVD